MPLAALLFAALSASCAGKSSSSWTEVELSPPVVPTSLLERSLAVGTFVDEAGDLVETPCADALRVEEGAPLDLSAHEGPWLSSEAVLIHRGFVAEGTSQRAVHRLEGVPAAPWIDACCAAYGCGAFVVEGAQRAVGQWQQLASAKQLRGKRDALRRLAERLELASMARLEGAPQPMTESVRAKLSARQDGAEHQQVVVPTLRAVPERDPVFANHVRWVEQNVWADAPRVRVATVLEDLSFEIAGVAPKRATFIDSLGGESSRGLRTGWELVFESLPPMTWQTLVVQNSAGDRVELALRVGGDRPFALEVAPKTSTPREELPWGSQGEAQTLLLRTPLGAFELPVTLRGEGTIHATCEDPEACGARRDQACVPVPGTPICVVAPDLPLVPAAQGSEACVRIPNTGYCLQVQPMVRWIVDQVDATPGQQQMLRGVMESMIRNHGR